MLVLGREERARSSWDQESQESQVGVSTPPSLSRTLCTVAEMWPLDRGESAEGSVLPDRCRKTALPLSQAPATGVGHAPQAGWSCQSWSG